MQQQVPQDESKQHAIPRASAAHNIKKDIQVCVPTDSGYRGGKCTELTP